MAGERAAATVRAPARRAYDDSPSGTLLRTRRALTRKRRRRQDQTRRHADAPGSAIYGSKNSRSVGSCCRGRHACVSGEYVINLPLRSRAGRLLAPAPLWRCACATKLPHMHRPPHPHDSVGLRHVPKTPGTSSVSFLIAGHSPATRGCFAAEGDRLARSSGTTTEFIEASPNRPAPSGCSDRPVQSLTSGHLPHAMCACTIFIALFTLCIQRGALLSCAEAGVQLQTRMKP